MVKLGYNMLEFKVKLGILLLWAGSLFACPPGDVPVNAQMANITASASCLVLRSIHTLKQFTVNPATPTDVCYGLNGEMSEDCTAACIESYARGIPDGGRDICLSRNVTAFPNCTDFLNQFRCVGSHYFCTANCFPYYESPNCNCKREFWSPIIKVDCGYGWFEPLGLYTGTTCRKDSTIIVDTNTERELICSEVLSIDSLGSSLRNVEVVISSSKFQRWFVLRRLTYQSNLTDHVMTEELLRIQNSSTSTRLSFQPSIKDETLEIVCNDDLKLIWKKEMAHLYVLSENVTNADLCNRKECSFCEDVPNQIWCKIAVFGYGKTVLLIFFILLGLIFICWASALFLMACNVVKFCFCTPIRLIRRCLGYSPKWYKKLEKSKSAKKNEVELENMELGEESDWEGSKEFNIKSEKEASIEEQTLNLMELPRSFTETDIRNKRAKLELLLLRPKLTAAQRRGLEEARAFLLDAVPITRVPAKGYGVSKPLLAITILSLISGGLAQCTDSILSESGIKTCVNFNTTHRVCTVHPKIEIGLSGPGSKTCITLLSNQTAIYPLNITFLKLEAAVKLATQYVTADWSPVFESSKSCFLQHCCSYGSYHSCEGYYDDGAPSNPCSKFSERSLDLPGKSGCKSYAGCAGNGCFSCASSCNYYRAALQPSDTYWNVSRTSFMEIVAQFKIDSLGGSYIVTTRTPQYEDAFVKLELIGVFNDISYTFNKGFVTQGSQAIYADVAPANAPVKGIPGDIQANNADLLHNAPSLVSFATDIYSVEVDANGMSAEFWASGMSRMPRDKKLPTDINGQNWEYDKNLHEIRSQVQRRLAAILKLEPVGPVDFYEQVDETCPEIKSDSINITGCYDCSGGANVRLSAKSTCYPGQCFVISLSDDYQLSSNIVYLKSVDDTVSFGVLTSQTNVDFLARIMCGDNHADFNIRGKLDSDVNIYNNGQNQTHIVNHDTNDDFEVPTLDWMKNLLGLPRKWAMVIIGVSIVLFVVLIAIAILVGIVKFSKTSMAQKMNINIGETKSDKAKTLLGYDQTKKQLNNFLEKPDLK